jgi:hypothetical protein
MDPLRFVETTAIAAPDGLVADRACLTIGDPEARTLTARQETNPAERGQSWRLTQPTVRFARDNVIEGILLALTALVVPAALLVAFILLGLPGIPGSLISMGATVLALAVPMALLGTLIFLDLRSGRATSSNGGESTPSRAKETREETAHNGIY